MLIVSASLLAATGQRDAQTGLYEIFARAGCDQFVLALENLSFLCLCRKRAIFPLRTLVCGWSFMELALSKSSFRNFLGRVFHCMMIAAPKRRRI